LGPGSRTKPDGGIKPCPICYLGKEGQHRDGIRLELKKWPKNPFPDLGAKKKIPGQESGFFNRKREEGEALEVKGVEALSKTPAHEEDDSDLGKRAA